MIEAIKKFLLSLAFFGTFCGAIAITKNESRLTAWFLLLIYVAFPVLILTWVELARAFRNSPSPTLFILGVILGLPQALFGLFSVIAGVSIIGWVLYNTFITRQPEYTGGFLTFGIGPILTLFGVFWIREAFTRQDVTHEEPPA